MHKLGAQKNLLCTWGFSNMDAPSESKSFTQLFTYFHSAPARKATRPWLSAFSATNQYGNWPFACNCAMHSKKVHCAPGHSSSRLSTCASSRCVSRIPAQQVLPNYIERVCARKMRPRPFYKRRILSCERHSLNPIHRANDSEVCSCNFVEGR